MARLRLFAALREAAGASSDEIEKPDLATFLDEARRRYGPEFARSLEFASVMVNREPVDAKQASTIALNANDEVALLPPVSGGRGPS